MAIDTTSSSLKKTDSKPVQPAGVAESSVAIPIACHNWGFAGFAWNRFTVSVPFANPTFQSQVVSLLPSPLVVMLHAQSPAHLPFAAMAWLFAMMSKMFFGILAKLQVFNSVVVTNAILVMHYFSAFQKTAKVLLHYKPVLKNIPTTIPVRMIRASYQNVARAMFDSSTSPSRLHLWMRKVTFSAKPSALSVVFVDLGSALSALCFRVIHSREDSILRHSAST